MNVLTNWVAFSRSGHSILFREYRQGSNCPIRSLAFIFTLSIVWAEFSSMSDSVRYHHLLEFFYNLLDTMGAKQVRERWCKTLFKSEWNSQRQLDLVRMFRTLPIGSWSTCQFFIRKLDGSQWCGNEETTLYTRRARENETWSRPEENYHGKACFMIIGVSWGPSRPSFCLCWPLRSRIEPAARWRHLGIQKRITKLSSLNVWQPLIVVPIRSREDKFNLDWVETDLENS